MAKNYTFRCEKLDSSIKNQIEKLKEVLNCSTNNELLILLVKNHIILQSDTEDKINKLCVEQDYSRQSLLSPIIERYVNKTLKSYGVVKEPNKKTVDADNEMQKIIDSIIKYYEAKPKEERKYLTASMISKFLYKNDDEFSTKHISVIKRALITHHKIIEDYHKRNKLDKNTNYLNRKTKSN